MLIVGVIILVAIVIALLFRSLIERYIDKLVLSKHIDPTIYVFAKKKLYRRLYT